MPDEAIRRIKRIKERKNVRYQIYKRESGKGKKVT